MDDWHSDLWPSGLRVSKFPRRLPTELLPTKRYHNRGNVGLQEIRWGYQSAQVTVQTAEGRLFPQTRCLEGVLLAAPTVETRTHTRAPSGELQVADADEHHAGPPVLIFLGQLPVNHDDRGVCRARFGCICIYQLSQ